MDRKLDLEELDKLLLTLKIHGVAKFQTGDTVIFFEEKPKAEAPDEIPFLYDEHGGSDEQDPPTITLDGIPEPR